MLLSFCETHKDNGDLGRESGRGDASRGRGRGRGSGRGGHGGGDGAAPRKQTPGPPTSRCNDAATSGNTKKLRCIHQGCPSPQTHDTSACDYHAQLVLDRKREREKAACAAAFFSALSSNKSSDGSVSSYYSCLSDTDSTDSACLSATPASADTSASLPSSSFWACFAPATATCYATINCDKKKSAVLDSGALVDIISERHHTGQLTDSPEMVQGISGTTHACPTRVHKLWRAAAAANRSEVRRLQTSLHAKCARPNPISLTTCRSRLRATFPAISTEKLANYPVQETDHCGSS